MNQSKPERDAHMRKLSKKQMDMLNFDKEFVILLDGQQLPKLPLAEPLSDHKLRKSSLTEIVEEIDFTDKSKSAGGTTAYGIYGFCDLP